MKVVLIDVHGMNGGAEKVLLNLNEILNEELYSVCLFPKKSIFVGKEDLKNVDFFNDVLHLIKILRGNSFDVIVLNNKTALKLLLPLKLFFPKTKIIFYSHSFFRTKIERIIYNFICIPLLHKVICVSESLKKNHVFSDYTEDTKHIKIFNGFDYDFKIKRTKPIEKEKIKIFFWAQFREWKGHLFFLDVFKELTNQNENIELHLVANIQDEESENIFYSMKEKIKKYDLENKIFYHLDIDNYLDYICENANLSISCSQLKDPLPTIIIESLSMGVPILATDLGGSKEMLRNFPFLLSSPSKISFLNKLKDLIKRLEDIDSVKLHRYYCDNFSKENYRKKILIFFNTI